MKRTTIYLILMIAISVLGWMSVAAQEEEGFCEPPEEVVTVTDPVNCDDPLHQGESESDYEATNGIPITLPAQLPKTGYSGQS